MNGWFLSNGPKPTYSQNDHSTSSTSYSGAPHSTSYGGSSSYNSSSKEKACEYCRQYRPIKFRCQCNTVEYCSEECKYKDVYYHSAKCKFANEVDVKQKIDMSF